MQTTTNRQSELTDRVKRSIHTPMRWLMGLLGLLLLLPGLVLAQGTNISFPGFRSSYIAGTDVPIIATANYGDGHHG